MKLDFWMNKIQDLNKSEVQEVCKQLSNVFYYGFHLFRNILTGQFMKTGNSNNINNNKKKTIKRIKSLNFVESNAHRKTNARGSFET